MFIITIIYLYYTIANIQYLLCSFQIFLLLLFILIKNEVYVFERIKYS